MARKDTALEEALRLGSRSVTEFRSEVRSGAEGLAGIVLCRALFEIAHARARRLGMNAEASEECALEFVQHMLLPEKYIPEEFVPGQSIPEKGLPRLHLAPRDGQGRLSQAWLCRCADNFARNVRRRWRRLQHHEAPWPEWVGPGDDRLAWDPEGGEGDPSDAVLRQELMARIQSAVARLTPRQQELFGRHYLQDEPVSSLASALGQTPHAVSQCLSNIRKRLRSLLERQGLDEMAAREYLRTTTPPTEYLCFPRGAGRE